MLIIVGVILIALGLLSGAVLLLATVGLIAATPGLTLWLTFPSLCIVGFILMAMQAQPGQVRTVTVASSALLLLMALASIVVLVLSSASLIPLPSSSATLWFVLGVGALLGTCGAASFGRNDGSAGKAIQ
jgi:hypothetical protein